MTSSLPNQIPFISHLFSIYTAPEYQLIPALEHTLTRHTGTVLYLSGNYPLILHNLRRYENRFDIRIVTTGLQALKILEENRYDLVLFEHDRSLYENTADLLRPIGRACRKNSSEQRTVALFSTRPDGWLKRMEEFAHRSISIEQANLPKMAGSKRIQFIPAQRTLDAVW